MARVVYSAPNTAQAQWVRDRLEESGIPVTVSGEPLIALSGGLPVPEAAITISVARDQDFAAARSLIEEMEAPEAGQGAWACPCGEANPTSFLSCWKCGQPRGENASAIPATAEVVEAPVAPAGRDYAAATKRHFFLALALGCAPVALLGRRLLYDARLARLPLLRHEIAINLGYIVPPLVCLVVLRLMGLRFAACWRRDRYWPLHILLAVLVGWLAYWFQIFELILLRWPATTTPLVPALPADPPLVDGAALVAAMFIASMCVRLLLYGAVLPVLRSWLPKGPAAYLVTSLLLAMLWNIDGGLRLLAMLFGLEVLFGIYFWLSKRVWAVALASTVMSLVPMLPHR
jgi:hypothetical protein